MYQRRHDRPLAREERTGFDHDFPSFARLARPRRAGATPTGRDQQTFGHQAATR
jgi:hypothetical protein